VSFFDAQFRRQIAAGDYRLNPFEEAVIPFLQGSVLDLGCGLGNLSLAAARRGAHVTALDACPDAVADLNRRAREAGLDVTAQAMDLRSWRPAALYDAVASIGLFMFFASADARSALAALRGAVGPGGIVAVNVLVEGTTYLEMFDPRGFHLFARRECRGGVPRLDDRARPRRRLSRARRLAEEILHPGRSAAAVGGGLCRNLPEPVQSFHKAPI
jgi:tellurite methyltransferase